MASNTAAEREARAAGEAAGHGPGYTTLAELRAARVTLETERHDYEPSDSTSPMRTDPSCRICGKPKRDRVHR